MAFVLDNSIVTAWYFENQADLNFPVAFITSPHAAMAARISI